MAEKTPSGKLAQVTGKNVAIDPAEHYDAWAETYERDLLEEYGYCAHDIAVVALAEAMPDKDAAIIDVGCGTGLVGAVLHGRGYTAIDGVDIAPKMLALAGKSGAYRRLILQNAEAPSSVPQAAYDAVICVGSFGAGHLGPGAIGGLVKLALPGAPVVIFMNAEPYVDEGYEAHLRSLETAGAWQIERIEDHNYMDALDRPGKLIVARRTA